jgi:long-chain acyl-CoA synthetase
VPVAFVVLDEPNAVSEDNLKQFTLQNGPAYAHPRRIYFMDALPLASTNKLDRVALKAKARVLAKELAGDD